MAEVLRARLGAEPDLDVVAATSLGSEAVAVAGARHVDVASIDADLGDDDGVDLARRLRETNPSIQVVYLTGVRSPDVAARALVEGARGWVEKGAPTTELLRVIRGAVRGETWVGPQLLTHVLARLRPAVRDELAALSPRQLEVLQCLVDGLDRPSIAARLGLARNTVRTHIQNIIEKLGVHSAVDAIAVARGQASRDRYGGDGTLCGSESRPGWRARS